MVYDVLGAEISPVYNIESDEATPYDISGNELGGFTTFLDAFKYAKRQASAENGILVYVHTDEHGSLNPNVDANIVPALQWLGNHPDEFSAFIGLGDTCVGTYSASELTTANTTLANLPRAKRIEIGGNHDVWMPSGAASPVVTDFNTWITYFDNSNYNGFHAYDNRNNAYMIDAANNVKYVTVSSWYWKEDGKYYQYVFTGAADYLIDALEANDGYDVVVLSHIQPLSNSHAWTIHAVADNTESVSTKSVGCLGTYVGLESLIEARKAKTSGSWIDVDGVSHSYDFTGCTSDLVCWLSGHEHIDEYTVYHNVPIIVLSALHYAPYAHYFISIHPDDKVSVWKVTENKVVFHYDVTI